MAYSTLVIWISHYVVIWCQLSDNRDHSTSNSVHEAIATSKLNKLQNKIFLLIIRHTAYNSLLHEGSVTVPNRVQDFEKLALDFKSDITDL